MAEKLKDRFMTVRLPADIDEQIRKMAEENTRTLAAEILHCIKLEIERQNKKKEICETLVS